MYKWFYSHEYDVALGVLVFCAVVWALSKVLHRRKTYTELVEDYGLYGVVGEMGAGKTYLLAWMGCRAIAAGRAVFANFPLDGAQFLNSWTDVVQVPKGSLVLLSELHLCWPVHQSRAPQQVEIWCTQIRKRTITCLWDSQYWTQVSLKFRKLTFRVWEGHKAFRAHEYKLYGSYDFGRRGVRGKPLASMFIKRRREVEQSYDTKFICEGFGAWWEKGYVPAVTLQRPSCVAAVEKAVS